MIPIQIKIAVAAILCAGMAIGVWSARGWYEDSKWKAAYEEQKAEHTATVAKLNAADLKTKEEIDAIRKKYRNASSVVYRTIVKRVCFNDAERMQLNEAAGLTRPTEPEPDTLP